MIAVRAAWCLPMAGPARRRATVLVDEGRIVDLSEALPPRDVPVVELPRHVVMPALVNAHTHLELSWMASLVPPDETMPAWAARLVTARRAAGGDDPAPMAGAIAAVRAGGTGVVGDIGNTLASVPILARTDLAGTIFVELIGFNEAVARERLTWGHEQCEAGEAVARDTTRGAEVRTRAVSTRVCLAAHAPYSVSPALLAGVAHAGDANGAPWSLHLGESVEEMTFLQDGTGPWRALLEAMGAWDPSWRPPGCGPVEYLARLGVLGPRLVAAHGVQLTDAELAALAGAGASLVTCPRSNEWTGAGRAPVARFYASGVRVAVGTDSLASVASLNVFDELAHLHRLAPDVQPARLLESATIHGAGALGWAGEYGSLETGKRAMMIAVELPSSALEEHVARPDAWLVQGVDQARVSWPATASGRGA